MKRITLPRAPRAILVALLPFALVACSGGEPAPADADVESPNTPAVEADPAERDDASSDRAADPTATASNRLQHLVPTLVEAMFTGFPGNSGETVRISVEPEKRR